MREPQEVGLLAMRQVTRAKGGAGGRRSAGVRRWAAVRGRPGSARLSRRPTRRATGSTRRRTRSWRFAAPPFETVGGFDERFFLFSEETDLCERIHDPGWQAHVEPRPRSSTTPAGGRRLELPWRAPAEAPRLLGDRELEDTEPRCPRRTGGVGALKGGARGAMLNGLP
jgi:hypothetical protein